ncbi:MobA/MobL family protein (plasmid) [Psychrobacter sp. KFRI-CH2-11]|uniref:MobA/MobL family protein n=1 Tax=Psychrobacter sp. KFRI-CH2-11 TaxID=3156079 RepID=UPI0032448DAF
MAIFRAETKSLSRGKSHNLAAAISYRAGIKLTDNNTINPKARSYDYTKKTDVVHSEILLPKSLSEQLDESDIELDFQSIADLVEIGETTKRGKMKNSARLAREWVLCGVPELTRAENIELFEQFAQQQSEEQGVLSMVFVHDPTAGDDMATTKAAAEGKSMAAPDPRNIHAHILLLTRKLDVSSDSLLSLGEKSDSELSNDERTRPVVPKKLVGTIDPETGKKIQQGRGLCSNSEWLKNTRKQWADILNERLIKKGVQPVTHKSYREIGLKFKPTKHLGKNANNHERRGIRTVIGEYNESVNEQNRAHLKFATDGLAIATEQKFNYSQRWIDWLNGQINGIPHRIEQSAQRVSDSRQNVEWTDAETSWAAGATGELNRRIADSKQCIEDGKQCIENRKRDVIWAVRANERFHETINSTEQQVARTAEQERSVNSLIAKSSRRKTPNPTRPNPFNDEARRTRTTRISEQEERFDRRTEQFDRDIARNRSADARTAEAARRLQLNLAMALLSRHHENSALQHWETIEDDPDKFDARQLEHLDKFAQTLGADGKVTDFIRDSRRTADLFTGDIVEHYGDIIKILRHPAIEREEYSNSNPETSKFAPQSNLNELTRDSVDNDPKTSNDSIPVPRRRYKP